MFYDILDFQRRQLDAWLDVACRASSLTPVSPLVQAQSELVRRTLGMAPGTEETLEDAVRRDTGGPVEISELSSPTPFARLLNFRRAPGGPTSLYVAPYSGYATAVTSALVTALGAGSGNVEVVDWIDARDVSPERGGFGLDDQIRLVADLLTRDGEPRRVVGLSQSGPAVVAGAALAMARGGPRPLGMILLGSPMDTGGGESALLDLSSAWPSGAAESQLVSTVPSRYPGAGREVYPGFLQLLALAMSDPGGYADTQRGTLWELVGGVPGRYERMHGQMHGMIDVPAELFRDMLLRILRKSELARGRLEVDGTRIDPSVLANMPLLTIEARGDALVAAGQTHAAHAIIGEPHHPASSRIDVEGGHDTLFVGPAFGERVAPALEAFMADRGSGPHE